MRLSLYRLLPAVMAACVAQGAAAATTLNLQVLSGFQPRDAPPEGAPVAMGQTITLILTVPGEKFSHLVTLPSVAGLRQDGSGSNPNAHTLNFFVTPSRKGDIVIPAFDVRADDGKSFHVNALKLRVGG